MHNHRNNNIGGIHCAIHFTSHKEKQREEDIKVFMTKYDEMSIVEIYSFCEQIGDEDRQNCIMDYRKLGVDDEAIKRAVSFENSIKEIVRNLDIVKKFYQT